eukprot:2019029-Heterocapsa_arctica.AAC.1
MSRMLLQRLLPILDASQSANKLGFRPKCFIEDAFTVLEDMCSKQPNGHSTHALCLLPGGVQCPRSRKIKNAGGDVYDA